MRAKGHNMTKLDLPYVKQYRDQTGMMRRYFRRGGRNFGALPGDVGSPEFMEAYQNFLGSKPAGQQRSAPGTFGRLISDYYRSVEFANLKPYSRKLYRQVLEPLIKKHGHKPLRLLNRDVARDMIQKIGETRPGMANLTKGILNRVFRIAIDAGQHHVNPFARLTAYKIGTRHTWTEAELAAFEKRWPLGTRQRLAYALLLYTGQRAGDVVKMHRRDIVDGEIHLTQTKTGAELQIPIHSELRKAMKAYPTKGLSLFGDERGKPVQRNSLTTFMRKAIADAGLDPRCVTHGLRKALSRRMAEGGASSKTIAAVTGHKTLKEIERYTAAAEQPKLAKAGLKLIKGRARVSNVRKGSV